MKVKSKVVFSWFFFFLLCAALVLEEKVALIEACVGLEASVSVTGATMIETVRAETNIFTVD